MPRPITPPGPDKKLLCIGSQRAALQLYTSRIPHGVPPLAVWMHQAPAHSTSPWTTYYYEPRYYSPAVDGQASPHLPLCTNHRDQHKDVPALCLLRGVMLITSCLLSRIGIAGVVRATNRLYARIHRQIQAQITMWPAR